MATIDTVTGYIQAILQRAPNEGEAETYAAWVDGGGHSLTDVVNSLIASPEAQSDVAPVIRTYQAVYGRVPDAGGLDYWVGVFRSLQQTTPDDATTTTVNEPLVELLKTFVDPVQTPEFATLYGSNPTGAAYIQSLYLNVLNRAPDAAGLAYWTSVYNAVANEQKGADGVLSTAEAVTVRAILLEQFVSSAEYKTNVGTAIDAFLSGAATGTQDFSGSLWDDVPNSGGGQTYTLVVDPEQKTGTAGNDTFNGTDTTVVLDVLNGAGGADTLNYNDSKGGSDINAHGLSITSIETINVRSIGAANASTDGFTGVNNLNVLQGTSATVVAGDATDVDVSGVSGVISIDGGKNITVTDSTAGKSITIGATTVATGNVTVTDSNVGGAAIAVDGGKNVTLTLTGSASSKVTVGGTDLPTGTVVVTSANKAVAGADETLSDITVTGGSTITVTQTATSSVAATDKIGATVTQGDVTVTGGTGTTSVTVTQAASTTETLAVTGVAGSSETASVKFGALKSGDTLIIGGDGDGNLEAGEMAFKAAKDLTAAQVAQAFANLTNPETQGNAAASNGVYTLSGAASLLTTWTSGSASSDAVVFTSTQAPALAGTDVTDLAFGLINTSGSSVAPVVTTTNGVNKVVAVTGKLGVINGTVTIDDNATAASITTVTVDGYGGASNIGATNTLSKLQNLTLANSGSTGTAGETDAAMTVNAAGVTTLALGLNNIKGGVSLDGGGASIKTLNVSATGNNSTFALTAAATETLAVSGEKALNLTGSTLTTLKTVTVAGSAGLTLDGSVADTVTSVDTTGTSGTVTTTIEGARASYTGGAGTDVVTLATDTALTKAISLGAGNDLLSFGSLAVTGSTAALSGGDGTDTLAMTVAAADGLDATPVTFYTGFEHLLLSDAAGDDDNTLDTLTLNLANLGFTNFVTTSGTVTDTTTAAKSDVLVLDKLVSGGTVELTANGLIQVNVTDAATGTSDVLNAVLLKDGSLAAGTLTAANVETINLTTTDPDTSNGIGFNSLTLTANKAASVTITGNTDLTLTLTGSTSITSIDGSALTGGLTVTSLNTTSAATIKGGSGNDVLTAATGTTADVIIGGAGNDVLTANAGLDTLTGGTGSDTFVIGTASLNSSSYATITDFSAGDLIKFTGSDSFAASRVVQADTAVFQDYCNAAINALGQNDVAWFQYSGNTYLVMDAGADTTTFTNGQDFIVKLTGLVDLANASYDVTTGTIAIG